jgi:hypothetical protein
MGLAYFMDVHTIGKNGLDLGLVALLELDNGSSGESREHGDCSFGYLFIWSYCRRYATAVLAAESSMSVDGRAWSSGMHRHCRGALELWPGSSTTCDSITLDILSGLQIRDMTPSRI